MEIKTKCLIVIVDFLEWNIIGKWARYVKINQHLHIDRINGETHEALLCVRNWKLQIKIIPAFY